MQLFSFDEEIFVFGKAFRIVLRKSGFRIPGTGSRNGIIVWIVFLADVKWNRFNNTMNWFIKIYKIGGS